MLIGESRYSDITFNNSFKHKLSKQLPKISQDIVKKLIHKDK